MSLSTGDLVNLLLACIAALSALYAKRVATEARRANELTNKRALRDSRLTVYRDLKEFLHFCSTYRTMQFLKKVEGTCDLVTRIESFKWEIDQHGPLDMPKVQEEIEKALKNAWQLQRCLDRLTGPDPRPLDSAHHTAEDNVDGLIDWFGSEEKRMRELFDPYLQVT